MSESASFCPSYSRKPKYTEITIKEDTQEAETTEFCGIF